MGLLSASLVNLSCRSTTEGVHPQPLPSSPARIVWFPEFNPSNMMHRKGVYFIPGLKGYQQTTDYTCGPAALLSLAAWHGVEGMPLDRATELRIAREIGTRSFDVRRHGGKPGTKPDEMGKWLERHGFEVRIEYENKGDGLGLEHLKRNLRRGIPTLVAWADLTGHWAIAVGYDTRGNDDPWDDVLILADSYDRYDDHRDGYSFVNANRFYWLWFDAFYFDQITWRTMITAVPKRAAHGAPAR